MRRRSWAAGPPHFGRTTRRPARRRCAAHSVGTSSWSSSAAATPKDAVGRSSVGRLIASRWSRRSHRRVYDGPDLGGDPVSGRTLDDAECSCSSDRRVRADHERHVLVPCHRLVHAGRDRQITCCRSSRPAATRVFVDGESCSTAWTDDARRVAAGMSASVSGELETTVELACRRPGPDRHRAHQSRLERIDRRRRSRRSASRRARPARIARSRPPVADVAVVVVGTNDDWETEGFDRIVDGPARRPGRARARRARGKPRTRGRGQRRGAGGDGRGPTRCRRVLQAWFGGQEMAGALADVLHRCTPNPAVACRRRSRVRIEHNPSFGNFPGENGEVRYGEGVLVGYRWYEAAGCRCASRSVTGCRTRRSRSGRRSWSTASAMTEMLRIEATVTNVGTCAGSEVVQCYVAARAPRLVRPPKELRAFAKVALDARRERDGHARPSIVGRSPTGTTATPAAGRALPAIGRASGGAQRRGMAIRKWLARRPGHLRPPHRPVQRRHRTRRHRRALTG